MDRGRRPWEEFEERLVVGREAATEEALGLGRSFDSAEVPRDLLFFPGDSRRTTGDPRGLEEAGRMEDQEEPQLKVEE